MRCQDLIDLNSEKGSISFRPNKPRKKVNKKPIIAPSHVFFGDSFLAKGVLPRNRPPIYAIESLIQIKIKMMNMIEVLLLFDDSEIDHTEQPARITYDIPVNFSTVFSFFIPMNSKQMPINGRIRINGDQVSALQIQKIARA
jgi:hypothetical protein